MPKSICVHCKLFLRIKRSGVYALEMMPIGDPLSQRGAGDWRPYKLWACDLWACRSCGHELIHGFGLRPIREQHEPDFAEMVARLQPIVEVRDC